MRNEDEEFAEIVKQEFDEHWNPSTPPPVETKHIPPPPPPLPDFHLNLYDDDESYRDVQRTAWAMSGLMKKGLVVISVGLVIALIKILVIELPTWTGWIAVGCFIAGTAMCVWHLTHAPQDDDGDGTV